MSADRPDRAEPPEAEPPEAEPAFAFDRVGVRRGERWAVRDVSARVPEHGVTVVVGPSGAGKSTLLRLCNRLEVPSEGRVCFRSADVQQLDPMALRRRVGMVSQRPVLFGGSVRDNLRVALPRADDDAFADALSRVALDPSFLSRPGTELSGGEAQRVCLARTLVTGPDVLLLDEPTAALDAGPRHAFERLARALAENNIPILWVTHDLEQMRRIADRVLVLVDGRLAYAGDADGVDAHQELVRTLHGEHAERGRTPSPATEEEESDGG